MAITNNPDVSTTLAQYKALYVNGDNTKVDSLDEAAAIIKFAEKDDYKLIKSDKNLEVANALLEAYDFMTNTIKEMTNNMDLSKFWIKKYFDIDIDDINCNVIDMLFPKKSHPDKYQLDDSNARTIKQ